VTVILFCWAVAGEEKKPAWPHDAGLSLHDLFGDRRLVRRPPMDLDRSDGEDDDDDDTQAAKGVRAAPMQPKTRNDRCM